MYICIVEDYLENGEGAVYCTHHAKDYQSEQIPEIYTCVLQDI